MHCGDLLFPHVGSANEWRKKAVGSKPAGSADGLHTRRNGGTRMIFE